MTGNIASDIANGTQTITGTHSRYTRQLQTCTNTQISTKTHHGPIRQTDRLCAGLGSIPANGHSARAVLGGNDQ